MFLCSNQAYKLVVEPETPLNNGDNSLPNNLVQPTGDSNSPFSPSNIDSAPPTGQEFPQIDPSLVPGIQSSFPDSHPSANTACALTSQAPETTIAQPISLDTTITEPIASSNTVAKPTAFDNSITEPQNISEVGSITTLTRSPVVDSLKSNCISSHLLINLASYITSPNPTPDVRFPCEVTYMMTEEFGANDYEYDSQIKYINDRIEQTTDLKKLVDLQDERAQLQHMQLQSQQGLINDLQEERELHNLILEPDSFSNPPPPDDISEPAEEDEDNDTKIQVTRIAVQAAYIGNKRKRNVRYDTERKRLRNNFINIGIRTGCYGILYLRRQVLPILTSINYYRGGTGVLANEKEAPVIFTNAIHENSAYLEMATREMTSIVEWENGFRESQQAESVPQRFP